MKVFISWSGELSNKIANILREWMPCVIQSLKPYVSSKDIDKGARWSTDIAQELKDSRFGIICVTKDNINAPWINFEAGALSKAMDKSNVAPFLFDIKRSEVNGPILQFQSTIFEKDDIKSLMITINGLCGEGGLSETHFERSFEKWYPALEKELNSIKIDEFVPVDDEYEPVEMANDSIISDEALKISKVKKELKTKLNFIHSILYREEIGIDTKYKCMMVLNFFKSDLPVIYDMGKDLIDDLNSNGLDEFKIDLINHFMETSDLLIRGYLFMKYYDNKEILQLYLKGLNMLNDQYLSYISKKIKLTTSNMVEKILNKK